jgi:hypothetical protein
METMISEYQSQAIEFLTKTNTEIKVEFIKTDYHFIDDKSKRDIYKITLKRGNREYSFNFGQSINDSVKFYQMNNSANYYTIDGTEYLKDKRSGSILSQNGIDSLLLTNRIGRDSQQFKKVLGTQPDEYSVLSSLTTIPVDTFEDFCDNYGYDKDSIKAFKIYELVKEEWRNIQMLFSDEEIEILSEIQ